MRAGHEKELESVMAALARHPGVRAAAAIVIPHEGRDAVVGAVESEYFCTGPMLREHAAEHLAEGIEISGVIVMDLLPRKDGRIDEQAIAAAVRSDEGVFFASPGDDVELRLSRMWSTVLSCGRVSMLDDFLDLGGDSLNAVELLSRIEDEFGVQIDSFDLMRLGNPRAVADVLKREGANVTGPFSTLHRLWKEALGRADVATTDDFFSCGGNSILAARLVNMINDAVERPISLGFLYQNRTLREQAVALDGDIEFHIG